MKWLFSAIIVIAVIFGIWFARIRIDDAEWSKAKASNNVAALRAFIEQHPNSRHVGDTLKIIDDIDWKAAASNGTEPDLAAYLKDHPNGQNMAQAKARLVQLDEARDWSLAKSTGSIESLENFLNKYPAGDDSAAAVRRLSNLRGQKDWDNLPKPRTIESLNAFLTRYPDGLYSEYARKLVKNLQADPAGREEDVDMALGVQTADDGTPDATGGVTTKKGASVSINGGGVSPGTSGFWKAQPFKTFTILAQGVNGDRGAIFQITSTVRWGPDGNVIDGEDNILRVTTSDSDHFVDIRSRYFKNGRLHLVTADGFDFSLYDLAWRFTATESKIVSQ